MQPPQGIFERISAKIAGHPPWISAIASIAGLLVSSFAGQLPESIQQFGLGAGIFMAIVAACAFAWHFIQPHLQTNIDGPRGPPPSGESDQPPSFGLGLNVQKFGFSFRACTTI